MNLICRTCLKMNRNFVNIYQHYDNEKFLSEILIELVPIEVQKNDGLPLFMCESCVESLKAAWNFRKMAVETDSKLRIMFKKKVKNKLQSNTIQCDTIKEETTIIKTEIYDPAAIENENIDIHNIPSKAIEQNIISITETDKQTDISDHIEISDCSNKEEWLAINHNTCATNQIQCTSEIKPVCPQVILKDNNKHNLTTNVEVNLNQILKCSSQNNLDKSKTHDIINKIVENEQNSEKSNSSDLSNNSQYKNEDECLSEKCVNEDSNTDCNTNTCKIQKVIENEEIRGEQNLLKEGNGESKVIIDEKEDLDATPQCNECNTDESDNDPECETSNAQVNELYMESTTRKITRKDKERMTVFCKECKRSFGYRYYFEVHVRLHNGDKPYKCDACDKAFVRPFQLKLHQSIHSDEKPFSCDVCGKTFRTLSTLQSHMLVHRNDKPFKCNLCNKGFKQEYALKLHLRRHKNEKKYICEICGKAFPCSSDLSNHKYVHADDNVRNSCPKCGKTFANRKSLLVHLKRHSDEKRHACSFCGKRFREKQEMNVHVLIHTGEKPFSCDICGKSFRQRACIPRHMRIHTGETPYPCTLCPSKFKYSHHLLNHMKMHK